MNRILIIDDDLSMRDILVEAFSDNNEVKVLTNSGDLFHEITTFKPCLIIIDYFLTGIHGGKICSHIKKNPATAHIPVILLSAYPKVLQPADHYGCDNFLEKPFDLCTLVNIVNTFIQEPSASD